MLQLGRLIRPARPKSDSGIMTARARYSSVTSSLFLVSVPRLRLRSTGRANISGPQSGSIAGVWAIEPGRAGQGQGRAEQGPGWRLHRTSGTRINIEFTDGAGATSTHAWAADCTEQRHLKHDNVPSSSASSRFKAQKVLKCRLVLARGRHLSMLGGHLEVRMYVCMYTSLDGRSGALVPSASPSNRKRTL